MSTARKTPPPAAGSILAGRLESAAKGWTALAVLAGAWVAVAFVALLAVRNHASMTDADRWAWYMFWIGQGASGVVSGLASWTVALLVSFAASRAES